jgi:hypothetical protein
MTAIRGLVSRNLNICLIVFSSVFVILRIYVRAFMTKSLGLDDAFSVAALVRKDTPNVDLSLGTDMEISPSC